MPATPLIIFDPSGPLAARVAAAVAVQPDLPVLLQSVHDWGAFQQALGGAPLPIVILTGDSDAELLARLVVAADRRPAATIVVVGAPSFGPMLELRQLGAGCLLDQNLSLSRWQAVLGRMVRDQQQKLTG